MFHLPLVTVDASERFLAKLAGVTDPEQKRKIIGREFIAVFEEEVERPRRARRARRVPRAGHPLPGRHRVGLVQGAVRDHQEPPQRRRPARGDEARARRAAARALQGRGAPARHRARPPAARRPAPAVPRPRARHPRASARSRRSGSPCSAGRTRSSQEEIRAAGLYEKLWQAFAVLLPVRSVGVMGDERTYEATCAIRAIESTDGMTGDWARLPYDLLGRMSSRDHQRGPRHQPRRVRHLVEAARDHRVGVARRSRARSPDLKVRAWPRRVRRPRVGPRRSLP